MTKLTTLASAASFLAIVGLSGGAHAGSERHRDSGRVRPVGEDLLTVDTREATVIRHGDLMIAALALSDEEGYARVASEAKLVAPSDRGLQVRALSTDDEFESSSLIAQPGLDQKLGRTEQVRTIQVRAITTSVPASELALSDEE